MRDAPSRTAEAVCFMRATDQKRPQAGRILDDPWARHFLGPTFKALLAGWTSAPGAAVRHTPWMAARLVNFVLCRHRFMDDVVLTALAEGADQLLVLGAGYDTRIWRLGEAIGSRPVYEVDHPSTAARKQRCLQRHTAGFPADRPSYVHIDFQQQHLDDVLDKAGFARGKKTIVVWEGVSMYLSRPALGATMNVLRELCGPGSRLLMDFWHMVDGPGVRDEWLRFQPNLLSIVGEKITLSLHPDDAPALLQRSGWTAQDIATAPELERRYVRDGGTVYPPSYVLSASTSARTDR